MTRADRIACGYVHDTFNIMVTGILSRLNMEKALVLITLKMEYSSNLIEQMMEILGVTDSNLIYGPYDAYAIIESETKEGLRDAVMKIREVFGVHATLTCSVIP